MADALDNPAANYYSGPPLNYDAQAAAQAQARPPPAADEQAAALPPAPPPEPQRDAGEGEHANHTQVHGLPGYYKARVNKTKTAASDQSSAVAPLPPPAPAAAAAPTAVQVGKELSFVDKLLMCFKGGKTDK